MTIWLSLLLLTVPALVLGAVLGAVYERHRTLHAVFRERCRELSADILDRENIIAELRTVIEELHAARHQTGEPWKELRWQVLEQKMVDAMERHEETAAAMEQRMAETVARSDELLLRFSRQLDAHVLELTRLQATTTAAWEAFEEVSSVRERTGPPRASGTG